MDRSASNQHADLRAILVEAVQRLQRGELTAAKQACNRALGMAPAEPEALHLAGLIAHRQGHLDEARTRLHKTVEIRPDVARFRNSLGVVLRELGETEAARHALEQAIRLRPGFAGGYYNLGLAHEDRGDHEAALSAYQAACEHDPDLAGAHHARGLVLQMLGRFEEAREAFHRALEIEPDYPEAHFHLAHARRAKQSDDPQLARIEALAAQHDWPAREKGWLYTAIGKLNDDLGHYDQAFSAYDRANRATRVEHDPDARDEWADRVIEAFSAEHLQRGDDASLDRADRIFIVGMPRSGTTLLEAMVSRHPQVAAGGERMELQATLTEAGETLGLREPRQWAEAQPRTLRQAANILDSQLEAPGGTAVLADKLPGNIWRLGLVGMLMPNAPVLLTWRDPRDVGLSCYFTRFETGQQFSYDLYHCGRQIRTVHRLAKHWLAVLPNPVQVVSYESLVTDPETTIHDALACCGLDPTAAMEGHSQQQDVVTTASSWQVRQGLYRRAIKRWQNYEAHLEPLLRGLGSTPLDHPPDGPV